MDTGLMMPANSEKQLSDEQSRSVAALVREQLARRRISRQHLADQAKISISTLEKALAGRSRSPPPSGWKKHSASPCARPMRTAPTCRRRRSR